MQSVIKEKLLESVSVKQALVGDAALLSAVEKAAKRLLETAKSGGTIYSCGNGGSACDAIHFTEEMVARYKRERPGIKAMHFMDPGVLSCWANDYAWDQVFERQVKTFCGKNDTLLAISTSGNSQNVVKAVDAATKAGTFSIGLLGKGGGKLKDLCTLPIVVPSNAVERIQESHITLIHILCELVENNL